MKDIVGKVAFITGGSSGIGLGIAKAFADAGMKVVISYRTRAHLEEAMECLATAGKRIHAIHVDVTDREGLESAAEEALKVFGRVHVLVNNAGTQLPAQLNATSYADWDRLIEVNVTGIFNGVHTFLPRIQAHGEGGHIITTASVLGLFAVGPGYGAYCASKFAAVGLTEALRVELAGTNVGVSVFCPGMVKSNLETALKDHPIALDPFEVGKLVLQGMQNNDLYILTHPELAPVIQLRHEALIASMINGFQPTQDRIAMGQSLLSNSIYAGGVRHR